MNFPSVDIIIPHFRQYRVLDSCLRSLGLSSYPEKNVIVVNNDRHDVNMDKIRLDYPNITVIDSERNLGYAGAINLGLEYSFKFFLSKYVIFLNDDTEHEQDWLIKLVKLAESDSMIGAIQPKIISYKTRFLKVKSFDYAGGVGGRLTKLCYPFAYGRNFFKVEFDNGQYNNIKKIFWASGAAMFVNKSAIKKLDYYLDESFFAHMEEIDLSWRLQMIGYKILACPSSVVYHHGATTLNVSPMKTYLNHRNNIKMLIKNKEDFFLTFTLRVFLEIITAIAYLASANVKKSISVIKALFWNIRNFSSTLKERRLIQKRRNVSDKNIFTDSYFG